MGEAGAKVRHPLPAWQRVVQWQAVQGRHDLPWQQARSPYTVWLSEIMLQQTQVATVRDYYARFLARFADVQSLAAAPLEEVMGLWSGLGYYSRARNLHACARKVVELHGGEFPRHAEALKTLPGIGPSTAAAISSLCFGERVAIMDGNVKRVLTRFLGFDADLAKGANQRHLWALATGQLPQGSHTSEVTRHMPAYTQGMMDLGATVCLARQPLCEKCPLSDDCVARLEGRPAHYPVKTRTLKRSAQSLWLLWAVGEADEVLLEQRPERGIWGGLLCFAVFDDLNALKAAIPANLHLYLDHPDPFVHVLTHKDLHLHPVRLRIQAPQKSGWVGKWFGPDEWAQLGLPAPIRKLLMGSAAGFAGGPPQGKMHSLGGQQPA